MDEKEDRFLIKVMDSKVRDIRSQFSFYDETGRKLYSVSQDINNEIVRLHDIVLYNIFDDIDYYKIVGNVPMWIRNVGHSEEGSLDKAIFEKLVKLNNNYLTHKFLYYHDFESLVNSLQNRVSMISDMIDILFNKLTPLNNLSKMEFENIGFTTDIEIHALLNTVIINVCSSCDILTKIAHELSNLKTIAYDKYPKMISKDILYGDSKRLESQFKIDGTIFESPKPLIIKKFESLRNEIIHNGSIDFYYNIYYGEKDEKLYNWVLIPSFDKEGNLTSYNSRRKFYPIGCLSFNEILTPMVIEFLTLILGTVSLLNKIFACSYYESEKDIEKYKEEILNWYTSFISTINPGR